MTRVGLTQRVSIVDEYGERRDCLDQEWTHFLDDLGYTPVPIPNQIDSIGAYIDGIDLDAFILTSGNDLASVDNPTNPAPERDAVEKAIVDHAIENEMPVLGVCRGLELLNTHFGGSLIEVSGHAGTTHEVDIVDPDGLELPRRVTVNSYHDFGIEKRGVGEDLDVFCTAPDGTVEGVVHETSPVWGLMWHPERESPSEELDRPIVDHVLRGER